MKISVSCANYSRHYEGGDIVCAAANPAENGDDIADADEEDDVYDEDGEDDRNQ